MQLGAGRTEAGAGPQAGSHFAEGEELSVPMGLCWTQTAITLVGGQALILQRRNVGACSEPEWSGCAGLREKEGRDRVRGRPAARNQEQAELSLAWDTHANTPNRSKLHPQTDEENH